MNGLCRDCRYYEPFEVFWELEKWVWVDDETPEGEAAGLADYDESARYHAHEQWKTRRWGRCLLAETFGGSLKRETSKFAAIDEETWGADVRCAPDFGCVQFSERPEKGEG